LTGLWTGSWTFLPPPHYE